MRQAEALGCVHLARLAAGNVVLQRRRQDGTALHAHCSHRGVLDDIPEAGLLDVLNPPHSYRPQHAFEQPGATPPPKSERQSGTHGRKALRQASRQISGRIHFNMVYFYTSYCFLYY